MTIEKVLSTAAAELGTRETGSNIVKYNDEYWGEGYRADGASYPWCVVFLWWVFKHSGAAALFPNTAHCDGVRAYAKQIDRWYDHSDIGEGIDLQPGDIIILDYDRNGSGDHIALVEAVANNNRFVTIEGNYADAVQRVNRTLEGVSGVYRPAYDESINENDDVINENDDAEQLPQGVKNGDIGYKVRVIQAVLMLNGYSLAPDGIDGEFGPITEAAVKGFQRKHGLTADGIVGTDTLKAMWEGGD